MKNVQNRIGMAAALCLVMTILEASTSPAKPNIVIVLADDVGFSDFGCYGGEILTPNIDQLAENGLRFSQFSTENKCNPSRTSLLTGQYYIRGYNAGGSITLAEGLQSAGYRSYVCGKWDVVADTAGGPLKRGFDSFYGNIRGCGSFFAPMGLQRDGENAEQEWMENKGFYYTHAITENAIRYMEQTPEDTPFLLLVTYTAAHWPMHALPKDIQKYEGRYAEGWDVLRKERLERMKAMGIIPEQTPLPPRDRKGTPWEDAKHKEWEQRRMEVYAAMVDSMDQGIGTIVESLNDTGRLENTLFMVLADNGASAEHFGPEKTGRFLNASTRDGRPIRVGNLPSIMPGPEDTWQSYGPDWAFLSSTPFRMYKGSEHQGGHAEPLVVHWPRVIREGGRVSEELCHVMDVLPTVLDAAGLTYPTEYGGRNLEPADGKSLLPVFQGLPRKGHERLVWGATHGKAVRQGKWKLVKAGRMPWELYNMETDRTELHDLAGAYPEKVQELGKVWEGWRDAATLPEAWRDLYVFPQCEKKELGQ